MLTVGGGFPISPSNYDTSRALAHEPDFICFQFVANASPNDFFFSRAFFIIIFGFSNRNCKQKKHGRLLIISADEIGSGRCLIWSRWMIESWFQVWASIVSDAINACLVISGPLLNFRSVFLSPHLSLYSSRPRILACQIVKGIFFLLRFNFFLFIFSSVVVCWV